MSKAQDYVEQTREFVREYTSGLNVRDLKRLFDEDASAAWEVLARDRPAGAEPEKGFRVVLHRAKVLFLAISAKLSPARRLLFAFALVTAFLGILDIQIARLPASGVTIEIGSAVFWFLPSVAALVYLLIVELVDRVRVRDELEVARQLQRELLPGTAPELPGWEFAHSYRTANEVGGDYYDFQPLADGRLALVVGDASGHGIAAGLLMAIANATLKTAVDLDPAPLRVATLLNRALYRTGDRRAFMTVFYGLLDPATGRLDYVCAGHPFPLLRRRGGEIEELGSGGLPLGIRERLEIEAASTTIGPGELLALYSDGLPEALGEAERVAFGFRRLAELLAGGGPPAAVLERALADFDRHVGTMPLHDDLTLVVVGRGTDPASG